MNFEPTVYIVDDEEDLAETFAAMVQSVGLNTKTFSNARVFLESYPSGALGCLVTDLRMPGMSGSELQKVLAARGEPIPVIIVSGFADVPTTVSAMKEGAFDVIEKGGSPLKLLESIRKAFAFDLVSRGIATDISVS